MQLLRQRFRGLPSSSFSYLLPVPFLIFTPSFKRSKPSGPAHFPLPNGTSQLLATARPAGRSLRSVFVAKSPADRLEISRPLPAAANALDFRFDGRNAMWPI